MCPLLYLLWSFGRSPSLSFLLLNPMLLLSLWVARFPSISSAVSASGVLAGDITLGLCLGEVSCSQRHSSCWGVAGGREDSFLEEGSLCDIGSGVVNLHGNSCGLPIHCCHLPSSPCLELCWVDYRYYGFYMNLLLNCLHSPSRGRILLGSWEEVGSPLPLGISL